MLIFVLGESTVYESDLEDCFDIVSTDIQKIFDYLSLDKMSYMKMTDYSIIIKIDGEDNYYEELPVYKTMFDIFETYPPTKLLEYESEYDDMMKKIHKWCEEITIKIEEERKRNEESERLKKEHAERALYEKLKRKYGN